MTSSSSSSSKASRLLAHFEELEACRRCPGMHGPPVHGRPVVGRVLLVGQAPGAHEPVRGRPFAHTAGKTLFKWLHAATGLDEEQARDRIFFAAVCRCFPGKSPRGGGDRVPDEDEMAACAPWLDAEIGLLRPTLVLAVGKLAIGRFLPCARLEDVVGEIWPGARAGRRFDVLPLPHPSGASTWHHKEPGKRLLGRALERLGSHPAWSGRTHVRPV